MGGASELSKIEYYGLSYSRVDIIVKRGYKGRLTAGILSVRGCVPGTTRRQRFIKTLTLRPRDIIKRRETARLFTSLFIIRK